MWLFIYLFFPREGRIYYLQQGRRTLGIFPKAMSLGLFNFKLKLIKQIKLRISCHTSHTLSALEPHVARGYCIGQHREISIIKESSSEYG